MTVDTIALGFSPKSQLIFDNEIVKRHFAPFGPFPACHWNFEYYDTCLFGEGGARLDLRKKLLSNIILLIKKSQAESKSVKDYTRAKYQAISLVSIFKSPLLLSAWNNVKDM